MRAASAWWLGIAASFAIACDGGTIDAGNDDPEPLVTYQWQGEISNSYGVDCPFPIPSAYAGVWEGEFAQFSLPSGSKKIRLNVQGLGSFGLCGTIAFGDGEVALPTDAAAPYAPGLPGAPAHYENSALSRLDIVEGFPYEIGRGSSTDPVQLPDVPDPSVEVKVYDISYRQPYKAWCNLQTSYKTQIDSSSGLVSGYNCVPYGLIGRSEDGCNVLVDQDRRTYMDFSCTQTTLCAPNAIQFCFCNDQGCTVGPGTGGLEATFTFGPDSLDGVTDFDNDLTLDSPLPFHLTRVPQ